MREMYGHTQMHTCKHTLRAMQTEERRTGKGQWRVTEEGIKGSVMHVFPEHTVPYVSRR